MTTLLEYQTTMADALRLGDGSAASSLFAGDSGRRNLGLKVYANNRMHALVSALGDTFPAVRGLVGESAFTAIAVDYVRANPLARETLLIWYGAAFPEHLQALRLDEAARLADLARLEYAWLEAYHAPEAAPMAAQAIATLSPKHLVGTCFFVHPSLGLLALAHDVAPFWSQSRSGVIAPLATADRHSPQPLVVLRPEAAVLVFQVSAPVFACITKLRNGATFGEATDHLGEADNVLELQALIASGLLTGFSTLV